MNMMPGRDEFEEPTTAQGQDEPQSMSLLGGIARTDDLSEAEQLEIATGRTGRPTMGQNLLLLLLVTIIAGGTLYAMRLTQGDMANSAASREVDAKIEKLLARLKGADAKATRVGNIDEILNDTEQIVEIFSVDFTDHQVPVEFVQKNPFKLTARKPTVSDDPEARRRAEEEARMKRMMAMQAELKKFEITGINLRPRPIAVINGEFYKPGDKLGSFVIESMDAFTIHLRHGEDRFELSLKDSR